MINLLLGDTYDESTALLASALLNFTISADAEYSINSEYSNSYIRLVKTLQLILRLELSIEEMKYFVDNKILVELKGSDFLKILDYKVLKKRLEVEDDKLITFLGDTTAIYTQDSENREISTLYQFVHWDNDDVNKIIKYLLIDDEKSEKDLSDIGLFLRVVDIFDIIKITGLSGTNLISILDEGDIETILEVTYDKHYWLKLSEKVHNKIRTSQRDALVAYILNSLKQKEDTSHIDTVDKLFEYFLIDVQMDSCLKTSRIKQAISSVQLFIDRCLYNLEDNISPSAINAKQWEWMKRYRVWEANRKIFLHPENWLDPSLRSTKSPFFKEFEGELLQSDINDELATKALLNYLEKVDKVSQLEICGMCREDEETIHVIGKTAGIKQEYYYRRYDGTWSAWEKITLDLESGPVIPVFWDGRLFLFWTTVLQKGQEKIIDATNTTEDGDLFQLGGDPKLKVEVNLNWSEFYNEKWQEKRTSDFNNPISFDVTGEFNKSDIGLKYFLFDNNKKLSLEISHLSYIQDYFCFNNTHALPEKTKRQYSSNSYILRYIRENDELAVWTDTCSRNICEDKILNNIFYNTTDFAHNLAHKYEPFFLNDYEHAFFVDVNKSRFRIIDNDLVFPPLEIEDTYTKEIEFVPIYVSDDLDYIQKKINKDNGFTDPSPIEHIVYDFILDDMLIGIDGEIKIKGDTNAF